MDKLNFMGRIAYLLGIPFDPLDSNSNHARVYRGIGRVVGTQIAAVIIGIGCLFVGGVGAMLKGYAITTAVFIAIGVAIAFLMITVNWLFQIGHLITLNLASLARKK